MDHNTPKLRACVLACILLGLLWTGCDVTKRLPEGEELYTGANVKIAPQGKVLRTKALRNDLQKLVRPKPNFSLFGWRPRVWVYIKMGKTREKGFKHWVKNKIGEKPVLLSDVEPEKTIAVMMNRMENKGYFQSLASYTVQHKAKTAKILYTAKAKPQYIISRIDLPEATDSLGKHLKAAMVNGQTLLKPGDPYDLDVLKSERERIDALLKNQGFYFFNPEYLLFRIDSTAGGRHLNLTLGIKKVMPDQAGRPYKMNDIFVFTNYSLRKDSLTANAYGTKEEGYYFVNDEQIIKTRPIARNIYLESGKTYSRMDHNITLSRLMGMGVFKFANVKIQLAPPPDSTNKLDALIYLTPSKKKSMRVELQGVSKSNSFTGPELRASFRNRSAFKGAELLILNLNGSFETQFGGFTTSLNSYELGASSQLVLPFFVSPVKLRKSSNEYVPKTKFELGFRFVDRVQFFNINSFNFTYGYRWKEIRTKEHEFNPLSITLVHLVHSTPRFDSILNRNSFLRKSFADQFIIGSTYSFTFNNQDAPGVSNPFFFNGVLDLAGNLLQLGSNVTGAPLDANGAHTVFGRPFSQYTKVTTEIHYTYNLGKDKKIATRFIAGVGVPYGNSMVMPYLKQFFMGGSNSIRAFLPRSVGPGSYALPDSVKKNGFSDQSGDIKLEANAELRFGIISVVKGALFLDAGNIWLVNDNPQLPGGKFSRNTFLNQVAVGTGFGVRFDISFIVLRLDLGFPLRKPWLPGDKWVANAIRLGDPSWRKENLVLNVAIGYPF